MMSDQKSNAKTLLHRRHFLTLGIALAPSILLPQTSFAQLGKFFKKEDEVTQLFNAIRKENRLSSMSPDPLLQKAAQDQAERMAQNQKMGHSIGWGNDFGARVRRFGIKGAAAENVAAGQPDLATVFKAWMNSKGHRKNMLDPEFSHYGLAYAVSPQKPSYRYWALVLGR